MMVLKEISRYEFLNDFYLAGGTALSLKYGHRFSEDFDFFVFFNRHVGLFKIASFFHPKTIYELSKDTLIFLYKGVKLSFFEYNYPFIKSPMINKDFNVFIASDEDIAAMKAIAIMQRGEKKDFFDLWYLLKNNKWTLKDITCFCRKKYSDSFNDYVFFKSLTFFEDAEKSNIKEIDIYWKEIKDYFKELVKGFYKN